MIHKQSLLEHINSIHETTQLLFEEMKSDITSNASKVKVIVPDDETSTFKPIGIKENPSGGMYLYELNEAADKIRYVTQTKSDNTYTWSKVSNWFDIEPENPIDHDGIMGFNNGKEWFTIEDVELDQNLFNKYTPVKSINSNEPVPALNAETNNVEPDAIKPSEKTTKVKPVPQCKLWVLTKYADEGSERIGYTYAPITTDFPNKVFLANLEYISGGKLKRVTKPLGYVIRDKDNNMMYAFTRLEKNVTKEEIDEWKTKTEHEFFTPNEILRYYKHYVKL